MANLMPYDVIAVIQSDAMRSESRNTQRPKKELAYLGEGYGSKR